MKKTMLVIGGNSQQYVNYCKEHDKNPRKHTHVNRQSQLVGLNLHDHNVVFLPTLPSASAMDQAEMEAIRNELYFRWGIG